MPDTKIKQLSTIVAMQQSILVSTQRAYNRQFSRSMKDHTSKINRVRDELNRLRMDKDKFQKQQKKQLAANDDPDSVPDKDDDEDDDDMDELEVARDMTHGVRHEEILQILKHKSREKCKMLSRKVKDFTEKLSVNTNPTLLESLSRIDQQQQIRNKEKLQTGAPQKSIKFNETISHLDQYSTRGKKLYETSERNATPSNRQTRRTSSDSRKSLHWSECDSTSPQATPPTHENFLPSFHSDQFVNTMVSNARARLVALYQQSILGPGRAVLIQQQRSQSANAPTRPKSILKQRKAVSAKLNISYNYNVDRRPEIFYRRSISGESRPEAAGPHEDDEAGSTASQDVQSERDSVQQLKDALGENYLQYEDALHKRMLIRDMRVGMVAYQVFLKTLQDVNYRQKAAEYDVKHGLQPNTTVVEVLSIKNSNISMALRRQSAIVALERSFLGQRDPISQSD